MRRKEGKMKYILNYSHPLTDIAKKQIEQRVGQIAEVIVPCQLDLAVPLKPQMDSLIQKGQSLLAEVKCVSEYDSWPDYIVPPALAVASAYIAHYFLSGDGAKDSTIASLIVLYKPEGAGKSFELSGIVSV